MVPEAQGAKAVSALSMSCSRPWGLTQDCSTLAGPSRLINVNGVEVKVAGNDEGTITVMFGGTNVGNLGQRSNAGFEMMKRELSLRGHDIVAVTPIVSAGTVFGYAIETRASTYALWTEFSVD